MQAREIMTRDPKTVTLDDTVVTAARIMRDLDVGIVPVVDAGDGGRLQGVITDRDIAVRHVADGHGGDCKVRDHMSGAVATVGPDDDVARVMERMRHDRVRRIPVVEDGGRLVGIIAQADLAVDTGSDEALEVERTVEEISQPAEPRR
jgi:CBS domain-containing protein